MYKKETCNSLQHTATHCSTLQHAATRCNTLQYTATRCNTLQQHVFRDTLRMRHSILCVFASLQRLGGHLKSIVSFGGTRNHSIPKKKNRQAKFGLCYFVPLLSLMIILYSLAGKSIIPNKSAVVAEFGLSSEPLVFFPHKSANN